MSLTQRDQYEPNLQAHAFIFGLMPIWEGMWPRCLDYLNHNRDTLRRDSGNLAGACQKVIECLCIILPSYNTYLITF